MKIFKALIFANALSVNAYAVNHREKRFISDVLQGLGTGMVDLGQTLEQNWSQVIGSSIQEVVDGILGQYSQVQLLQAIHEDWDLFIQQYGPAALFQALHDARLDLSQIISNIYTDLTIEELLQQLNPLYQLNEIVAGFAQSSSYTLAEIASALNGQYPGEFDDLDNEVKTGLLLIVFKMRNQGY